MIISMKKLLVIVRIFFIIPFLNGLTGCKGVEPWMPEGIEKVVTHGFKTWNFQDGADGFSNSNGETCQTKDGFLLWHQRPETYLSSPKQLQIPAGKVHTVEIRLATTGATLKLFWKQAEGASMQSVSIPLIADEQYHDYQIELGQNPDWSGSVSQLLFQTETNGNIAIDFIRLTGLYMVPFPAFSLNFETAKAQLNELKALFSEADPSVVIGYSTQTEYLYSDDNDDYIYYHYNNENAEGPVNPHYFLRLAKATDMPVMIWLRGDPWGYEHKQLYADDQNLMWTADVSARPAYRNSESGYRYLCLAREELDGTTSFYWRQTEKLLGQCAEVIDKLIKENPDHILGVTTTSELKFNTHDLINIDLDYNPKTIREFSIYCKQKYGTIEKLNNACETDFVSFELKSSDYDPLTVAVEKGFDAPRTRGVPAPFWNEWKYFRALQIQRAVQHQVECIAQYIDRKYIYTHQIASEIEQTESPSWCGNVPGANVGIDFFTHEATDAVIQEIADFVKDDPSRTWGVPEWLVMRDGDPVRTVEAMKQMRRHGIKYLTPFAWGFGEEFDVKDSPAFDAIRDYLKNN